MTITSITFDFWATLYQTRSRNNNLQRLFNLKEMVEQHSGHTFNLEQFQAAVRVARHTWSRIWTQECRTIPADEWLQIMQAHLGITLEPARLRALQTYMEDSILVDQPTLAPHAADVLAQLAARHKLAVISDTGLSPGRVLRQLLERDGIAGHFSHLTFSDELGRSKPHPDAFLSTLHALDVNPQQAVHVGDLLRTDIAGAQGVGMKAVQYTGITTDDWLAATEAPAQTVTPDAVISSHTQLEPLLHRWNGG